jgi:hypothetical protein
MKNIHVLTTDKPSRLVKNNLGIAINENFDKSILDLIQAKFINIYITSDEKIKEDWYYDSLLNVVTKRIKSDNLNYLKNYCKKIILTTDPTLISDGVQAIEYEFLEWLVKNPSCEFIQSSDSSKDGFYNSLFIP